MVNAGRKLRMKLDTLAGRRILRSKLAWLLVGINLLIQLSWVVQPDWYFKSAFRNTYQPCLTIGEQLASKYAPFDVLVSYNPLVIVWQFLSLPVLALTGHPPYHLGFVAIVIGSILPDLCLFTVLDLQNAFLPLTTGLYWFGIGCFIERCIAKLRKNKGNL
jgi:hypothetical protein